MNQSKETESLQIPRDLIGYCEFISAKSDREINTIQMLYKKATNLINFLLLFFSACVGLFFGWLGFISIPQTINKMVEKEFQERNIQTMLDDQVRKTIEKLPLIRFANLSSSGQSLALEAWSEKKFKLSTFRNKNEENKQIQDSEIVEQLKKLSTGYGWIIVKNDDVEITEQGEKEMNIVQLYFFAKWG